MKNISNLLSNTRVVRHLPSWFPGASFKRMAEEYKVNSTALSDVPYEFVKEQMKKDGSAPSFLANLLKKEPPIPGSMDETIIKWSAASVYAGGADTVSKQGLIPGHFIDPSLDSWHGLDLFSCNGFIPRCTMQGTAGVGCRSGQRSTTTM